MGSNPIPSAMPIMDADANREYQKAWQRRRVSDLHLRIMKAIRQSRVIAKQRGHAPCETDVEQIKLAFTGKCFLCDSDDSDGKRRLHVDHDHVTGAFRGWLCNGCNLGIGSLKDSVDLLLKAAAYLSN